MPHLSGKCSGWAIIQYWCARWLNQSTSSRKPSLRCYLSMIIMYGLVQAHLHNSSGKYFMARPKFQQQETAHYEQDWSDDNQDRCPGYRYLVYEIAGQPYETMILCEMGHPHQEAIKQPGNLRVPLYPWLKDLATERQAGWAIKNRQKRSEKRQDGRLAGVKMLREILGQAHVTHEDEELLHDGSVGAEQDRAALVIPGEGHRAALVPLAQDVPPDVEDWLATVPSKPAAADDDDWNKEKDIPEV